MSRVEEELVGSLTCFLIKHSGEKQLCLAIMDKETVFNLKGMKKECLLLMDSPNYRFSMPTVLNLIVKDKDFSGPVGENIATQKAEDVTGEIKVNSIVEGISFSDVLNSIIKLCNIVYEKFCPDVGSFPFL